MKGLHFRLSTKVFTSWHGSGLAVAIAVLVPTLSAQGTLRFDFEEYAVGEMPPNVVPLPPWNWPATVRESALPNVTPYSGARFLHVVGIVDILPPSDQLITAFSVQLYMPSALANRGRLLFAAGGIPGDQTKLDQWQTISGSFATPVAELGFGAVVQEGQTFPAIYYLDDIVLTTIPIPEPAAVALILVGAGIFAVCRRKPDKHG
jgi:hypothetical protein